MLKKNINLLVGLAFFSILTLNNRELSNPLFLLIFFAGIAVVGIPFRELIHKIETEKVTSFFLNVCFGFAAYSLVLLVIGQFGVVLNKLTLSLVYLFLLLIYFFRRETEKVNLDSYILFFSCLLLIAYFSIFNKISSGHWDAMTFWLISPKSIYLTQNLPQFFNYEEVSLSYTHFYPLHSVVLYHFFNHIVEQYTISITFCYFLTACLVVLGTFLRAKPLCIFLVSAYLLALFDVNRIWLYSAYADWCLNFYILLSYLYIKNFKQNPNYLISILLILFLISLLKAPLYLYSIAIAGVVILYLILKGTKENLLSFRFSYLSTLFVVVALYFCSRYYYLENFFMVSDSSGYVKGYSAYSINYFLGKIYEIGLFLYSKFEFISIFLVVICLVNVFLKNKFIKLSLLPVLFLALPSLNIAHYVINNHSMQSESLYRYVQVYSFILPFFLVSQGEVVVERSKQLFVYSLIVIVLLSLLLFKIPPSLPHYHYSKVTNNQGVLSHPYAKGVQAMKAFIKSNSKVAIAEFRSETLLQFNTYNTLLKNYFMLDKDTQVDLSQKVSLELAKTMSFVKQQRLDYLIILKNSYYNESLLDFGFRIAGENEEFSIFVLN